MPAGNATSILGFSPGVHGTLRASNNLRKWAAESIVRPSLTLDPNIGSVIATRTQTNGASTGGRVRWGVRVDLHAVPVLVLRDDVENGGACPKARVQHPCGPDLVEWPAYAGDAEVARTEHKP